MHKIWGFILGSDGKASAYNAGDPGSIPGLGRSPGEGNGNQIGRASCRERVLYKVLSVLPTHLQYYIVIISRCVVKVKSLSHVRLFVTPWTVAYHAPPSMGFSRQEYRSGLPFPSPEDLPDPGIEPGSPAL